MEGEIIEEERPNRRLLQSVIIGEDALGWCGSRGEAVNESFMTYCRDFFSGPVVKTSPSSAGGTDSMPHLGTRIPHALWPKTKILKNIYCKKFIKGFLKKGKLCFNSKF